jgi:peptidoglycan hydrolase-like protein with peptidoglycan-binding domain
MQILRKGSTGPEVAELQTELKTRGFSPGAIDGRFGPGTEAAIIAFQRSDSLLDDGIAGARTLAALGFEELPAAADLTIITVDIASRLFPTTSLDVLKTNLPLLLSALGDGGIGSTEMALMALATVRVETGNMKPISEFVSRFNTSPGGHPFDLYDNRKDLGNEGQPDGERFRGRGFVQLTGRSNYRRYSEALGLGTQLIDEPDLANEPKIAARLLVHFLKDRERAIKEALVMRNFAGARRLVNGGTHGLQEFAMAFALGERLLGIELASDPAS